MTLATSTFIHTTGAVSEGAVNLDLDGSLFVYLGVVIVFLLVFKPTLFDLMLRLFEEREKRIDGARQLASKEDERSAQALAAYETALAKAREEGAKTRDVLRVEAQKREADVMAQARDEAASVLDAGRKATRIELDSARSQLHQQADGLGKLIAERVLGREVVS